MSERRDLVAIFERREIAVRRSCQLLSISRRRLKYASKRDDRELVSKLKNLSREHPRFGVRRMHALIRRDGSRVNLKRVRRLCRKHGLLLKSKRRRKRRGIGVGAPCQAECSNQVWCYDFMEDRTQNNRKLRILTIVDEYTRRCIEVEVEHRMNAKFVARTLLRLFQVHGAPRFIRSDNGPEFIAKFLMNVLKIHGVQARHIEPGSPWQNGRNERFNGTLRDECLNLETFHGRDHARALVKLFAMDYNQRRPHSALGYLTPNEFDAKWRNESQKVGCAGDGGRGLSLCAFSDRDENKGPTARESDRPDDHRTIHPGAPVAPQQSRILRVDEMIVIQTQQSRDVPGPKVTQ